ncbi:MAG TPA: RsmD family RNA methyltransferase [Candidatus Krumholzibacteria bacterium]|nr:RsmD family RNA methyltransferase [Candidatus Krumholzibacteria bacterium]
MPRRRQMVTVGGGEFRGRSLRYPDGSAIRPTMQRTRLSLFSSLGERLDGLTFADLFAGAGAVGIEAASRGAARVHFVESDGTVLAALHANLAALGLGPDRCTIHARRVAALLDERPCPIAGAQVVFADPPYDLDLNDELLTRFRAREFAALRCLVVEHGVRSTLAVPAGLVVGRARRFGDTVLTTFVPAADGQD